MVSDTPALRHLVLGGYTADQDGRATGLSALINTAKKASKIDLEARSGVDLPSPSYVVAHPERPWVFAAVEKTEGEVASLEVTEQGDLRLISRRSTGGADPCHLAVSRDGRFVIAANYSSGSIATFAIGEDGALSERIDLLEFEGSGPDTDRQASSHAHQIVVDGDTLLVADLGADKIHRIAVEPEYGVLGRQLDPIELPAGSGPRHLVLVEDFLVVACELSGELWFAERVKTEDDDADDTWEHRRTVPTSSQAGNVQPSGIVAEGYRVFVANRGPDTIGVFDIGPGSDWIAKVTEFACGGTWPRDLTLAGGLLWVSNERSDDVSVFEISPLPPAAPVVQLSAPSPTCALWINDPAEGAA